MRKTCFYFHIGNGEISAVKSYKNQEVIFGYLLSFKECSDVLGESSLKPVQLVGTLLPNFLIQGYSQF